MVERIDRFVEEYGVIIEHIIAVFLVGMAIHLCLPVIASVALVTFVLVFLFTPYWIVDTISWAINKITKRIV